MAATEKKQMWLNASSGDVAAQVVKKKIAASQGVFMPGAPCYISQAGTVKLSDTSDGTGDAHHGFIVGVADKTTAWPITAELSANTVVEVALIEDDQTYWVWVENNGTDAAAPESIIGDQYGLTVSATAGEIGYTTLDLNNSNAAVHVVDVAATKDTVKRSTTETPGLALVRFLPAVINQSRA